MLPPHSQPFVLLPSQLAKPALHAIPQVPPEQAPTALVAPPQTTPQLPQLFASVATVTSQPFVPLRSQSFSPAAHARHDELEQYCPVVHDVAQVPQWELSEVVATSQPFAAFMSQSAKPAGQASV